MNERILGRGSDWGGGVRLGGANELGDGRNKKGTGTGEKGKKKKKSGKGGKRGGGSVYLLQLTPAALTSGWSLIIYEVRILFTVQLLRSSLTWYAYF